MDFVTESLRGEVLKVISLTESPDALRLPVFRKKGSEFTSLSDLGSFPVEDVDWCHDQTRQACQ